MSSVDVKRLELSVPINVSECSDLLSFVSVGDVVVYVGDEAASLIVLPILSDGGVVGYGGCFVSGSEFGFLYDCNVYVVCVDEVFKFLMFCL